MYVGMGTVSKQGIQYLQAVTKPIHDQEIKVTFYADDS
jgi:hypothetical protein